MSVDICMQLPSLETVVHLKALLGSRDMIYERINFAVQMLMFNTNGQILCVIILGFDTHFDMCGFFFDKLINLVFLANISGVFLVQS